ncbi:MAG: hypothetical protein QOK20_2711 [Acidimicrobiaceae bacterium]|nr:hypothetical protein [Acidimicrobiaceae bacterium]
MPALDTAEFVQMDEFVFFTPTKSAGITMVLNNRPGENGAAALLT